jgi:hypothetical protein
MSRAARDFRFDEVLANACQADRKTFCKEWQAVRLAAVCVCVVSRRRA